MINQIREEQPPLNLIRSPQLGAFQGPRIAESIINQQHNVIGGGIDNTRQYWNEKEQNWLRLSVNLNPLAFANYELFKSANIDISESPNPIQCILCFILKFIILILYFLTPYYQTMKLYEAIVILGAVDFWIIKNIRKLVGLRWWVEINDFGNESWVFETSTQEKGEIQRIHSRIFWFVQLFMFLMFVGMFIINASQLQISISICMFFPAAFTGYNLYAFNLCNKIKRSKLGESFLQMSVGRKSVKMPLKLE
ncbi:unnamed protein product [Paramecium primaurelia]|uniref:Golgi apparatus membrane protein TVP23 homolog n=1 Tax=Paramecium primaurelia TaxID=5886 RepID=A0A8S1N6H1_PARPR|nr:unnamed protein product [Paramecium primaurelia]